MIVITMKQEIMWPFYWIKNCGNLELTFLLCVVAANSYRFQCRHLKTGRTYEASSHDGYWGNWSGTQYCPSGTAICGLQTQVENNQGSDDDTALNDAKFYCCNLPNPCSFWALWFTQVSFRIVFLRKRHYFKRP